MNNEETWQVVLAQIQFNISQASFATWFKNTKIIGKENGQIIISVPNNFSKEWLENKYNKLIFKTLHELDREIKEVQYVVNHAEIKKQEPVSAPETDQLEFQEFKINRETNLNPRYSFENFVVGPFNELPHAAAWAVSKNPGAVYNPLFIYGGVGLGKTHLVQAIGDKITKSFPRKKVKYIPSEKFISGVVSSIRDHSIESFKTQYRKFDVLIIDDIQFLAGKEKTQEEFFHIFNALYEENKQIILSADKPPKAISSLEDRLRSRFEGGMIADVDFPDFETRLAILKVKLQEKKTDIPEDVLEYIATNIKNNIRELEGALNRVAASYKFNNKMVDLLTIKNLLKTTILSPVKVVSSKKLIKIVAEFYDLREKDLIDASRKKEIVKPRQIAMYLLREELKDSFPAIGRKFGGKDHTTAIHACTKISKEKELSEILAEEIKLIKEQLYL